MKQTIYLTDTVAKMAGLTRQAIIKAANDHRIKHTRTACGMRLYWEKDVLEFINNRMNKKNKQKMAEVA